MIWRKIYIGLAGCLPLLLFSSCIDDHFTDCARLSILYYMQQSDGDGAFSDTMSELDMSFYYAGNSRLAYRRFVPEEEMPADHIYRPVLPTERFDHLAIANFTPSSLAARGKDHRDYRIFHPEGADTIDVIETDVYVARKQLSVTHKEELIKVCLAPCVGKVRLHLNYDNAPEVLSTECFVGGIGSGFICYDSLFVHDRKLTMRMRDVGTDGHNLVMYESTSFPSRDRVVAASRNGVGRPLATRCHYKIRRQVDPHYGEIPIAAPGGRMPRYLRGCESRRGYYDRCLVARCVYQRVARMEKGRRYRDRDLVRFLYKRF